MAKDQESIHQQPLIQVELRKMEVLQQRLAAEVLIVLALEVEAEEELVAVEVQQQIQMEDLVVLALVLQSPVLQ